MLEEKITADYKEAMKARDQVRAQTLSFLRSELKYDAINQKKDKLEDEDVIVVLKRLIKQRQDSITQFEKGARMDLVEKEKRELELLKTYLPTALAEEELRRIVDDVVAAAGASSQKDMGRVMREVMTKTQGRADGKMVSDLVRARLSGGCS